MAEQSRIRVAVNGYDVISAYGDPEVLQSVSLPMPGPGRTDVLIRQQASSVTRAD